MEIGGALFQLTSDQPDATMQQLHAVAADMPVFANQGDVPTIVPPVGIVGEVPDRGIELTDEMDNNIYALIRIASVKPGDDDFSCTSGGLAKNVGPVFQIRIKNRSTIWRYFKKASPALALQESGPFPLTYFGNATTDNPTTIQKPAAGIVKVEKDEDRISSIASEIYI